jgi:uncharacterized membrane protein
MKNQLTVRNIVIAGVLGAVAILLGVTRLGFIPVPTAAGNATIMHIPAIIGGIMQGPVVGMIVGAIFGISSFLNATNVIFKDPLVSILPRLFIGVVAWLVYVGIRRKSEYFAVAAAAFLGTLTNTGLVLLMAVVRNYMFLLGSKSEESGNRKFPWTTKFHLYEVKLKKSSMKSGRIYTRFFY